MHTTTRIRRFVAASLALGTLFAGSALSLSPVGAAPVGPVGELGEEITIDPCDFVTHGCGGEDDPGIPPGPGDLTTPEADPEDPEDPEVPEDEPQPEVEVNPDVVVARPSFTG